MNLAFLSVFGGYVVITSCISYLSGRRSHRNVESFFLGNRALSVVVSALTYAATTYSAFMMVGLVGLSYSSGIGALIFELVYLVSTLILLSWLGPKIWRLSRDHRLVSPFDLLRHKYNHRVAVVASVLSLVALVPYTAVQVTGAALVLEPFGLDYQQGVFLLSVIIVGWAIMGGIKGVAVTDALQGLFIMAVALLAFSWSSDHFGGVELSVFPNKTWTWPFFLNLTLPWCFFAISNPPVLQRVFMLKDCGRSLTRMLIFFGIFGLLLTIIATFVGFQARYGTSQGMLAAVSQDQVTGRLMSFMPGWLSLLLAISIIVASITTANSILLSLSSVASLNLYPQGRHPVGFAKIFMLAAGVVVAGFALMRTGYIVQLSVASSRYLMVTVPAIFLALTRLPVAANAALASILFGLLATVAAEFYFPLYASLCGLGGSVVAIPLYQLVARCRRGKVKSS